MFDLLLFSFPSVEVLGGILGIMLLLVCSALISGSEIAFFSLTPNDYEKLEKETESSSKTIVALKDKPRRLLATILISNNFINIAIVILSDFVLLQLLPPTVFESWATAAVKTFHLDAVVSTAQLGLTFNFIIITIGVTFLLVLFGEVAPKVYARMNNIQLSRMMAVPLNVLMRVFNPISLVLVSMTSVIENRLSEKTQSGTVTSKEEIDEAIELTVSQEEDTRQEVDILKSIIKFGDVSVKQIMRSRVDVVAIDFRQNFEEVLNTVRDSGYSRIPVYENDFDNVTGILYAKDLLGHLTETVGFEWQSLIRTSVLYVPEAKKIDDLLKEFQRERLHMAIVVDEYGGSAGIVTLEDILEEIIGDIKDEFDVETEVEYQQLDAHTYLFEGKTLINDFCKVVDADPAIFDDFRGESDSLAGLMLELFERMPQPETEINSVGFTFKIVSVSDRRIEQILVKVPESIKYTAED